MEERSSEEIAGLAKADASFATRSCDGYVRLTFESFLEFKMVHLYSGMDEENKKFDNAAASLSSITGYTEWVCYSTPAITIGWNWKMTAIQGKANLVHSGEPGSNLMFVCQQGNDVGADETRQLLINWIKAFGWQTETLKAVCL